MGRFFEMNQPEVIRLITISAVEGDEYSHGFLGATRIFDCFLYSCPLHILKPSPSLFHFISSSMLIVCDNVFFLGNCYARGQGLKVDFKKAQEWLQKGIAQEDGHCYITLGI